MYKTKPQSNLYMLGTAPDELIYLYMNNNHVWGIQPKMQNIDFQSVIVGLANARDIVDQIKGDFDEIHKFHRSTFEAVIGESNEINPNDIHIYELGVVGRVI